MTPAVTRWNPCSMSRADRCRRRRKQSRPRARCCAPGQLGHRRNTTSWVKPEGRPSSASSRARATTDQEVTSGQYPVDWLLTSLTAHRSASRVKLISPALRTMSPPAQATCSLRRGASRSTPSVPTTKVNGSANSAADRSAIQPPKSAAELIRHPPLPGRTAAFSSTGPTYRYLRPRARTSANLEHFRHTSWAPPTRRATQLMPKANVGRPSTFSPASNITRPPLRGLRNPLRQPRSLIPTARFSLPTWPQTRVPPQRSPLR